jgi:hypothetical protein
MGAWFGSSTTSWRWPPAIGKLAEVHWRGERKKPGLAFERLGLAFHISVWRWDGMESEKI